MKKTDLIEVAAPVDSHLLLLCEKCGRKIENHHPYPKSEEPNPTRQLQREIKDRLKELGLRKQIRAVVTTCMDVCPNDRIAVALVPTDIKKSHPALFATLSPHDIQADATHLIEASQKGRFSPSEP